MLSQNTQNTLDNYNNHTTKGSHHTHTIKTIETLPKIEMGLMTGDLSAEQTLFNQSITLYTEFKHVLLLAHIESTSRLSVRVRHELPIA